MTGASVWTTQNEIDFAYRLSKIDRPRFDKYAEGIERRTKWDRLDGETIKRIVKDLKSALSQIL